ncbi:hypothetical protein [Cloacibacterium sp.]
MRTINLKCGDDFNQLLRIKEELDYSLKLIFNNEGQKLIDNTKTDLFN